MGEEQKRRYPGQNKEMKKERHIQTQKNHEAWDTEGSGNTWREAPEVKEREMRVLQNRGKAAGLRPRRRLPTERRSRAAACPAGCTTPFPGCSPPRLGPTQGSPISTPLRPTERGGHSLTGLLRRAAQKGCHFTCRCSLKFKIKPFS